MSDIYDEIDDAYIEESDKFVFERLPAVKLDSEYQEQSFSHKYKTLLVESNLYGGLLLFISPTYELTLIKINDLTTNILTIQAEEQDQDNNDNEEEEEEEESLKLITDENIWKKLTAPLINVWNIILSPDETMLIICRDKNIIELYSLYQLINESNQKPISTYTTTNEIHQILWYNNDTILILYKYKKFNSIRY